MRLLVDNTEGKISNNFPRTSKHNQPTLRLKVPAHKQFTIQAVKLRSIQNKKG